MRFDCCNVNKNATAVEVIDCERSERRLSITTDGSESPLWYSSDDYQRFKKATRDLSRSMRRKHEDAHDNATSYTHCVLDMYYSCLDLIDPQEKCYTNLIQQSFEEDALFFRGLEGHLSAIKCDRRRRVEDVRRAVLSTQDCFGSDDPEEIEARNNLIREMVKEHTESSQLFAAFLGKVDALQNDGKCDENNRYWMPRFNYGNHHIESVLNNFTAQTAIGS